MNSQNDIAHRAGITIVWEDLNGDHIDIQPNAYTDEIEFRVTYTGSNPTAPQINRFADIAINANTGYWLKVVVGDLGSNLVNVFWSEDDSTFVWVLQSENLPNLSALAGMSAAGLHLPHVYIDDFSVLSSSNQLTDLSLQGLILVSNKTQKFAPEHLDLAATVKNNSTDIWAFGVAVCFYLRRNSAVSIHAKTA
jgi:hypothetical protein